MTTNSNSGKSCTCVTGICGFTSGSTNRATRHAGPNESASTKELIKESSPPLAIKNTIDVGIEYNKKLSKNFSSSVESVELDFDFDSPSFSSFFFDSSLFSSLSSSLVLSFFIFLFISSSSSSLSLVEVSSSLLLSVDLLFFFLFFFSNLLLFFSYLFSSDKSFKK